MNKSTFNTEVSGYIKNNGNNISPNVLDFLNNSKLEKVEKEDAYDFGSYSPSDYCVTVWYYDKLAYISFMYQCEPNSLDIPLTPDELFEVYEIYSKFDFQQLA